MNENKFKTYCFGSFIAFVLAFVVLFGLRLNVYAASSGGSEVIIHFPFPYGPSSGYGAGGSSLYTQEVVDGAVNYFFNNFPNSRPYVTLATIYEVADNYIIFSFHNTSNGAYTLPTISFSGGSYPDFSNTVFSVSVPYGANAVKFDGSSYSFVQGSSNVNVAISSWCSTSPSGSSYLDSNKKMYGYPVWTPDYVDIVYNNNIYFTLGTSGGSDDFAGSATGSITSTGDGSFDLDININVPDYSSQLDDIGGSLDSIDGSLDSIDGNIDTSNNWLARIWQAITDYFTPPTQQEVQTALNGFPVFTDLTNTIGTTKTTVNSIFDFSQVQPKTADNVDFDYDFHFTFYDPVFHTLRDKVVTVHIVFSWFESIRTPVTLVLSVFLSLGFLVYIFRQIPNLINGVGAGASAGQSIADSVNNSKGGGKK